MSLAFYLFDVFARLSVGVVTTTLQTEFHMAADEVSLVFGSSFFYAYAAMQVRLQLCWQLKPPPPCTHLLTLLLLIVHPIVQLPWGFLMDGLGPRFSVAAACFLAAGGTALTGMAHSSGVGLLARIMTGAGCGGAWLGFIKVNRLEFRLYPRLSGSLLGLATCLGGVGALGSQKPFAAMVTAFGWRQAYIVSAALPFVLGICAMLLIRNTVQQPLQGTLVKRPFAQQRGGYGIVHASAAAAPARNTGTHQLWWTGRRWQCNIAVKCIDCKYTGDYHHWQWWWWCCKTQRGEQQQQGRGSTCAWQVPQTKPE